MSLKSTFTLLIVFISFGVFAQTVNIQGDPYSGNPYSDINAAVTAANDGDVILISGIHTETLAFNKSITLRGTDPTTDIIQAAATQASNGAGDQVISIFADPLLNTNITIENLGIRNGNVSGTNGGGIEVDNVTGLITLKNLIIEDNYTGELGGGLAIAGSNADIIDCTIKNNESNKAAGGIILAPNNGAGINSVINIRTSLIDNNEGKNGGGIYINGNPNFGDDYLIDVNIENSTISNNTANSGSGAAGGGAIWSKSSTWTTNDGGDGTSANVRLELIHTTFYKNFHAANIKSGIQGTGNNDTEFSAFNSIIVYDGTAKKAINFANLDHQEVKNCILGGLNAAPGTFLDNSSRNNVRGKTATFAGLSSTLADEGGNTEVFTVASGSNADDYCTATVTAVTLPTIDQTGYSRTGTADAGAFEVRCDPPTGISNDNIAATAASFSWTENTGATDGYEYVVVLSGGDPDNTGDIITSATLSSGSTQAGVTGLIDATNYDFYIRSDCGGGELGSWSPAVSFTTAFQGNLFLNSRFTDNNGDPSLDIENDGSPEWLGYGTSAEVDNIIGENIGFLANTEGLLRQDFEVIPGLTYIISFNYRWVSGTSTGDTNPPRTPVIRNDVDNSLIENLPAVQTGSDTWYTYNYAYTHPTSGLSTPTNRVRFQIFKGADNNQLNFYNITVLEDRDFTADYDFVYKNGAWSASPSTATSSDDIYVYDGLVDISTDITANDFEVSPWADVNVEGVLDLSSALTVQNEGVLTFKSDATTTGQLDDASGVGITGEVRVERYIPGQGNRAFRFLSSPVTTSGTIYENWQERGNTPTELGTHITGSNPAANGFDATSTNNPSMFTFDNSFEPIAPDTQSSAWNEIANTNTLGLNAGQAYLTFIRGDRNINLSDNSSSGNTTLRATGTLVSGNQISTLSEKEDLFSLVGNPYQAIIDVTQVLNATNSTNVNQNFYWYWDPNLSTFGAYTAVQLPAGTAVDPGDNATPSSSNANQFIMPGQSFFVQTLADGAANLTFTEASKAVSNPQTDIFSDEASDIGFIDIQLYTLQAFTNGNTESDALRIQFQEGGNNDVDALDAHKFSNPNENLFRIHNGKSLSIETRNIPVDQETLPLFLENYTDTSYLFSINLNHLPENISAYLKDNYSQQVMSLADGQNQFNFSVDANIAESITSDRFELFFENTTLSTNEPGFNAEVNLYPNPSTNGVFYVSSPNLTGEARVKINSMLGQTLLDKTLQIVDHKIEVDTQNFTKGIYVVSLSHNNKTYSKKLIVK